MALGLLQVRSVVAYILRNFELTLASASPKPDYSGFVVGPEQPCLVRYRRRKAARVHIKEGGHGVYLPA